MRSLRVIFSMLLAAAAGASPLAAQAAPAPSQDVEEVRRAVVRLFDGMRAGDSTVVRAAFHPQARLQTTAIREGQAMLRTDSVGAFVRAVGTPHTEVWDERISNVEIRVDGPLATAWMDYAFYRGDQFSHCGVNAFQFFKGAQGWQIIQITDTRNRECPRIPGARRPS
jgi:hypothetical protein